MTPAQLIIWNSFFPPGSPCWLKTNNCFGDEEMTHTRSPGKILKDGQAVVKIEGNKHWVRIDRLRMAETHKP